LLWIGPLDARADDGAALQVMDDGLTGLVVGQVLVGELGQVVERSWLTTVISFFGEVT